MAPATAPRSCARCGSAASDDARYCSHCGASIDGSPPELAPLIEAARLIAAQATTNLDAVLDALADQMQRFLAADAVGIQLAVAGTDAFLRRRAPPIALPGSVLAAEGSYFLPDELDRAAIRAKAPILAPRFHEDPRISEDAKSSLPTTRAVLRIPLIADDELVGLAYAMYQRDAILTERDLAVAAGLAQHAAVAIHVARAVEAERSARDATEHLLDAVHLLTARSDGLEQVIETLAEQARSLLAADAVGVNLLDETGAFVRLRPSDLANASAPQAGIGARFLPDSFAREVIETRAARFTPDFQNDPRISPEVRATVPDVAASFMAPLIDDDRVIGALYAHWAARPNLSPTRTRIAEALAKHAGVAIERARLRAAERRTHTELAAVLDAIDDSIVVYDAQGTIRRTNRRARERFEERWDEVARSLRDIKRLGQPRGPDNQRLDHLTVEDALAGRSATRIVDFATRSGERRRFAVHAAPLRDARGVVDGAVVISRDVTDLTAALEQRARLDGAVKTIRLVAHELNNALTFLTGYGDMLLSETSGQAREIAGEMADAAARAAAIVDRLQQITRFAEIDRGAGAMLDLNAATAAEQPPPDPPRPG